MNDKALEHAYKLFVEDGYTHSPEDFKKLIESNPAALNRSYELFKNDGYANGIDNFKSLVGVQAPKQEEPGFIDRAMSGISGLFSSDDEVKKKADSTVSPSGESSSVLPSKPKDEFQLAAAKMRGEFIPPTGTLEEQAKAVGGTDSYMGMTVPKAKTYAGKQEVKKEFEKQQEIAASAFDEQAKGTADFNRALSNVNKEMMDFDEEDITPKLQGLFGLYGYKFDYATDAREAVEVTAPNGKKKTIPVDAFTEAGDIESANEFKSFINANKPTLRQTTEQPFYQDRNYNRILNEEEAKQQMANINKITERQDMLESDLKALSINKEKLTRELNKSVIGSPEYLKREEQLNQLDNYIAETNKELDYFNKRDKPLKEKLMASMGSYQKAAAEQGGLLAASYNAALSASGGILAGINDMVGFLSSRMMEDATTEEKDASYQMVKERSPIIRESLLKAYGITSVSEEYLAAAQDDFLKRNVMGAAAFVPQLAGMAAAPEVAIPLFFLGGYDGTMEKMDNNPKFKNVSEAEKFGVATTAGVINTVLMKYNVGEKLLEMPAGKALMGGILKKMGSKTGATTIEEVVDNEVKGALSKGLITAAAGASHGFSLGAQIKVGEIVSEELYNKMKEEKLFDTPEDFTQAFHQVMESGLDMAMGSVLLGVPKTFQKSLKENNYQGITSEDLDVLNAYANSAEFLEFKKAQVGQKVASREITKEQGVQEIAALETNISIYKSIPENLSDAGKRKAMGLLSEKRQLDSFIQGKDKALVKKQIDRVAEINKQLEVLPDMKEEAPAPAEAATPSYSINGKEMSEQEFTKAVSEMSPEDVKKADIKANNATEGVTTLLKEVATRSGVESAPMMETTAPAATERITELETILSQPDNGKGTVTVGEELVPRTELETELETLKSKENAVQEPTTEEGVLRTEQPEVGLPKMGEGNAQETTTQEGVAPAKPQEVKPTEAKPIEQELAELEQMFPTEGPTGENKGVAASDTKAMEEIASRSTDERVQKVVRTAQKLTKTLKSLFPNAEINIHETEESYNGAMEEINATKESNGNFAFGVVDGKPFVRIDINANTASSRDVAHEVAHAVLVKTFGDNQKLFQSFQEKIAKVISTDSNQKLLDFANNPKYREQGVTYEEYMAELKAILSEEGSKIELSTAKKIAAVINEYVSKITKGAFKPFQEVTDVKQVVDFVNKVTEAMAKGEAIDVEAAGKMGEITSRSSLRTAEQVDKMVKDARASGYSEKAIEEFLKKRGVDQAIVDKSLGKKEAGTKIVTNEEMMPGYDKMMEDVNSEILRGLDRKTKETTIEKNVMKIVEGSEAYKNATDQQRNQMVRDVKEAFGEKMKQAPSAEKITGKEQKKVTVDVAQALKDQIKLEMKAALEGAKSVTEKIKAVKDYFDSVKDSGNLTRKDLTRVMDVIAKVKDEKTLDKAVNKINDIIDKATSDKIEISEKKMIANTIKEVKLAKGNIKEKRKLITDVIDSIKKSGKLTAAQVNALLKRANNLNVESFEYLNKFIDYAEKIFADADYDNKLSKGSGLRESIKNLSKNKSNNYNGSLVKLGEEFSKIDPSLVEDIEQYNKIASDLKDAIKGSSPKGFKPTVEIKAVDAYVEEMMKSQKEKITESTREQIEKLLGVDGSKFTYDEMMELIQESKEKGAKEKEKLSEENEKTVRTTAVKWFESLSSTIDHILKTGKDPFTGEPVNIKESKKDVIKRFMEMNLTKMDIKDAVRAVDALDNFIVNQSTAKMERVLSKYKTKRNMEMLIKNKITSSVLKIFRSRRIGRGLLREFGSETILMDALFKGIGKAEIVAKAMGLSDYKSNVSKAKAVVRNMVADYVVEFYDKKANGEDFNTAFNNAERGILAFVSRTKIGKEDASFKDRKSLVEQSIESLENGNEKEIEKAKLYQDVYDKILKDSKSLDDVKNKADDVNSKAVDFWIEKWSENYEELADVSENIHNVILGRFGNYTPDVVRRVKEYTDKETKEEDMLDLEGSAFLNNSGIIQKKSGRLEKVTVEDKLSEGSYYDFGFDNNNSSLMSDALIDAKTAGNVIELSTFLNSPEFKKIVTTSEERGVLKDVMSGIVRSVRGKEKYNYNEISSLVKGFNRASALGASYVLGGLAAAPKQYLVPAVNTMIASGGYRPHFDIWWNKAKQDFVNNSGESVANRGVMSNADIKNIDNLLQEAAKSTPEQALRYIEKINKVYLKNFLVDRDVAIAKASWLTYYEKSLRKQGKYETVEKTMTPSGVIEVKTKGIDYSKHEINREAAQYATRMVDRQQNISDEDFRGRFYSNKEGLGPIVTKVLLPFASFRINQWLRMNTDLGILTNKTTTYEDRLEASKSLAAAGVEIAFFNAIGLAISAGLHTGTTSIKRAITGGDEEDKKRWKEEDDKYWKNLLKSKGSAVVQDVLSPLPPFDPLFESLVYNTLDKLQSDTKEEDRINIFEPKPKEVESWLEYVAKNTGGAGILVDRALKFKEIADAYLNEKIETTNYGETTEKNIRERDKKALGVLTTLAFVNMLGILPTEAYNAQNTAFKEIKKGASTQTEAEIIQEKAKKREKRADNIEKIQVINRAINVATDQAVVNELMKMRKETRDELFPQKMSDEAKEVMKRKREREKASYKGLLGGYDTKTDLKRYNPDLYEQNFGEDSEYGQTHKAEVKADKLFDAMMKKTKDEKYGYQEPAKKKSKKRKKNSDGTYKSSYFRSSSR